MNAFLTLQGTRALLTDAFAHLAVARSLDVPVVRRLAAAGCAIRWAEMAGLSMWDNRRENGPVVDRIRALSREAWAVQDEAEALALELGSGPGAVVLPFRPRVRRAELPHVSRRLRAAPAANEAA